MKITLTSFLLGMDDNFDKELAVTGAIPPSRLIEGELHFDISLLLLADTLIYDKECFDLLRYLKKPEFEKIINQIEMLSGEGFIEIIDYKSIVDIKKDYVNESINTACQYPTWIPSLKKQINQFETIRPVLKKQYPKSFSEWDENIYGISNYLQKQNGRIDKEYAHEIKELIKGTNKRKRGKEYNDILKGVIHETVTNVTSNLYVSQEMHGSIYSWCTTREYYDILINMAAKNLDEEEKILTECRNFFEIAFPVYAPTSVNQWIKILKHSKAKDLKQKIKECVSEGINIDSTFAQKAIDDLMTDQKKLNGFSKYIGIMSTVASLGSGAIGGPLGGLAPALIQEGINQLKSKKCSDKHSWLYFTNDYK